MAQISLGRAQPHGRISSLRSVLSIWLHRLRSRRALARLNDDQLHDIGLDRSTAQTEVDRMFWQG